MGRMKSLKIVMEEELFDLNKQLEYLEADLAFLEHEAYSLNTRIEYIKDAIHFKKYEIDQQKGAILDESRRIKENN